jgi:aromatic ring hydroxylase
MSELFVGLAQLVTEMQGKDSDPIAQNSIAELITYAEMLRMSLDYAVPALREHESGMVFPQHSGDQCRPSTTTPPTITRPFATCTTWGADSS